jgi:hypothetical protein
VQQVRVSAALRANAAQLEQFPERYMPGRECVLGWRVLTRQVRHGASIFGRFALQDSAGLRAGRSESAGFGGAVWGQPCVYQEDSPATVAERTDGARAAVALRAAQPGNGGNGGGVARASANDAGRYVGRVAARAVQTQQVRLSRSQMWRVLLRLGLRLKKVASRRRAGQRRRAPETAGVVGADKPDRSSAPGVSGQERRDHGDDTPLRAGPAWGARRRRRPAAGHGRTLTVLGALTGRRHAGRHDHRIAYRW